MLSFVSVVSLLTFGLSLPSVHAIFPPSPNIFSATSNTNVVVYWGQGSGQKPLAEFCQDSSIDIIPIAFVNIFPDEEGANGYPGSDFGNACGGYFTDSDGVSTTFLNSCPALAADIQTCQNAGKKILISLGGGTSKAFVKDEQSAIDFANFLWEAFGPVPTTAVANVPRPFGSVVLDGFDFDIETSVADIPSGDSVSYGYDIMVNQLRSNFALCPGQTFYISAAPQCVVPDAHLATAFEQSSFDWIFVQFYNTPSCSARAHLDSSYGASPGQTNDISYSDWAKWVATYSQNKGAKIFLGLPAAPAGTVDANMYLSPNEAMEVASDFFSTSSFGGIMLWEATLSDGNQLNGQSYAQNMKCGLLNLAGLPCSAATTTTTTSTTSSSTTFYTSTIPTTSSVTTPTLPTTSAYFPLPTTSAYIPLPTTTTSTTTTTTTSFALPFPTTTSSSSTTTPFALPSSSSSYSTSSYSTSSGVIPVGPESSQPTPIFPFPTTTSYITSSSYSTTSSTTSSGIFPVGPESSQPTPIIPYSTSSTTSYSFTTTSSSSSGIFPVGPESSQPTPVIPFPSSTTSSSYVTTTTFSFSFPTSFTYTTTSSSTSSNAVFPVGPESSSITPATSFPFPTRSSSSTTTSSSTTSSTSTEWAWPASSSSITTTSPSVAWPSTWADPTVTVISTSYVDICPTGFTTKTWVTTFTPTAHPAWPTTSVAVDPHQCPEGFTTTVTVCTVCGPVPKTVTLTLPLVKQTQTVVPIAWTGPAAPAGSSTTKSISWAAPSKAWTTSLKAAASTTRSAKPSIWIPASSASASTAVAATETDWATYKPTETAITMGMGGPATQTGNVAVAPASTATSATTASTSAVQSAWQPSNAAPFSPQFTGAAVANKAFGGVAAIFAAALVGLLL